MSRSTEWASLAELVRWGVSQDPARPYLTYYDDTTGERVEVSFKTFGNWVAKSSHLLRDAGAASPGGRVAVWLPSHWQTVVVIAAAWSIGATVVVVETVDELIATASDVAVVSEDHLTRLGGRRPEGGAIVALSLRPMGGALVAARPGVVDFADEVVAQPDDLVAAGTMDDVAVELGDRRVAGHELLAITRDVVVAQGLERADRCLAVVAGGPAEDGLVVGSLACLVAGAGLVLCLGLSPGDFAARVAQEQVTIAVAPADWLDRAATYAPPPAELRLRRVLARGGGPTPDTLLGAPVTRA